MATEHKRLAFTIRQPKPVPDVTTVTVTSAGVEEFGR